MFDSNQSVASVVLHHSACAQVFQRHRIDFCCRGEWSLARAAEARGLALPSLLGELSRAAAERGAAAPEEPGALPVPSLLEYVVEKHHRYLREALPFLLPLAAKVARVHGEREPALREVSAQLAALSEHLLAHLDEEEQKWFPAARAAWASGGSSPAVAADMAQMKAEHLELAQRLQQLRRLADDYQPPAWACGSYRALFGELVALEADLFRHVHLENFALAPSLLGASGEAQHARA